MTGQLTTWFTSTPTQTWLDDLHTSLHLGTYGHLYSEFAASWLAVIALGGLILWWRRQRGKKMLTPETTAKKGVRRTRSFHASLGDWPFLAKLTQWGVYAHMGNLFGLANQLVLAALAIGLICVIVWGYRMWWQRRPTRTGRKALVGAPPVGRGAWQQLPAWAVVVGVPVVFAVGWYVPLLGIPLIAFLLADIVIGEIRSRCAGRPVPEVPVSPAPAGS